MDNTLPKSSTISIKSLVELEIYILKNEGKMINVVNSESITVNGESIAAWYRWFFPCARMGENFGIIVYPSAKIMHIITRATSGWRIHRVY